MSRKEEKSGTVRLHIHNDDGRKHPTGRCTIADNGIKYDVVIHNFNPEISFDPANYKSAIDQMRPGKDKSKQFIMSRLKCLHDEYQARKKSEQECRLWIQRECQSKGITISQILENGYKEYYNKK